MEIKWELESKVVLNRDAIFQIVKKAIKEKTGKDVCTIDFMKDSNGDLILATIQTEVIEYEL